MNRGPKVILRSSGEWLTNILSLELGLKPRTTRTLLSLGAIRTPVGISHEIDHYVPEKSTISIYPKPKTYRSIPSQSQVLYQHPYFLVVDKPAGVPTIPSQDNHLETALSLVRKGLHRSIATGPFLVTTRLDVGTHGLVIFARNSEFQKRYLKSISQGKVQKLYYAVVAGWNTEVHGYWKYPLSLKHYLSDPDPKDRSPLSGSEYIRTLQSKSEIPSKFEINPEDYLEKVRSSLMRIAKDESERETDRYCEMIIRSAKDASIDDIALRPFDLAWKSDLITKTKLKCLDIELITGKTHQIRAQLKKEGLFVVGDWLYGSRDLCQPGDLDVFGLCCYSLEFPSGPGTVGFNLLNSL
eukprot:TRINITY_DN9593_c0_g1_i1.p1 TRINITY_DN9593_c0_g1~~TRINITY_DN9593_c0_g1_i1.p1  ORF type:complete len:354 (-),score=55.10 TRINITY_DN9593_c0_g1_i1:20-1081(-)